MAKYLRTPCFSKPSTSASESVVSMILGMPPEATAACTPPALAMAQARARMSRRLSLSGLRVSITLFLRLRHRAFQDGIPSRDVGLEQLFEMVGTPLCLRRHGAAELGKLLANHRIVQCLVEGSGELGDDILRRAFRRKDRTPDAELEIRDAGLLGRGHVGQRGRTRVSGHDISLDQIARHGRSDADNLFAEIIDMAADKVVERRPGTAIRDKLRLKPEFGSKQQACHVRRCT